MGKLRVVKPLNDLDVIRVLDKNGLELTEEAKAKLQVADGSKGNSTFSPNELLEKSNNVIAKVLERFPINLQEDPEIVELQKIFESEKERILSTDEAPTEIPKNTEGCFLVVERKLIGYKNSAFITLKQIYISIICTTSGPVRYSPRALLENCGFKFRIENEHAMQYPYTYTNGIYKRGKGEKQY